ncbi:DUF4942 domain-containing protein [Undibacterium arcticum]
MPAFGGTCQFMQILDAGPFEANSNQLAAYTPLDALFSEYRKEREAIVRISEFAQQEQHAMRHFSAAAVIGHRAYGFSLPSVFEQEPAIKALDAVFWSKTISMTNILEVMPAKDRNEWNEQLRTHSTPEYEPATVRETMTALLSQREKNFFRAKGRRNFPCAVRFTRHESAARL